MKIRLEIKTIVLLQFTILQNSLLKGDDQSPQMQFSPQPRYDIYEYILVYNLFTDTKIWKLMFFRGW